MNENLYPTRKQRKVQVSDKAERLILMGKYPSVFDHLPELRSETYFQLHESWEEGDLQFL